MKSVKFFLTALCLSVLATFSFASENEVNEHLIMRVETNDAKALHITLANLRQITTQLKLEDLNGKVYYSDYINDHNGYGKNLSLRKLPKGRYILTVAQKGTEWKSVVVVDSDGVQVSQVVEK